MSRDQQRYRKNYSYYRPLPREGTVTFVVDESLDWKNSVRAASTENVALSGTTPITVGGVSLADEDRVLLKDQSTLSQNGIYYYEVSGGNYVLTRASDASQETLSSGATTYVEEGTNGGNIYILSTTGEITVDSTNLTWTKFSSGGGGGGNDYWISTTLGAIYSTGSVAIKGNLSGIDAAAKLGTDVFFFVSGSISGSGSNNKRSVFGGDVRVSGSLSVGYLTNALGIGSIAGGYRSTSSGSNSVAVGNNTNTIGFASLSQGNNAIASGTYSHAEGAFTIASGSASHAEGSNTKTIGFASHAEGFETISSGTYSHAEGYRTVTSGNYSHAEGGSTIAIGLSSHAEGTGSVAFGIHSHAEGYFTMASGSYQTVVGRTNLLNNDFSLFVVGNGVVSTNPVTREAGRSDIFRVNTDSVQVTGSLEVTGDQVEITGTLRVTNGISGSLTRLTDNTAYILAGPNITINTGSNGAVQITGSAGGGGPSGTGTAGYLSAWTSSTSLGDSHIYYWTGAPSSTTYRYKAYNNQFVSLNDTVQLVLETDNTTGARVGINSSGPAYPLDVSEGVAGTSTIASFRNTDASGGADRGIQMYMGAGNFNPGTFRLLHEWKTDRHYTRFRTTNLSSLSISGPVEDLLVLSSDRKVLVTGSLSVRYDGSSQVGTVVDVQKLDGNQIMWMSSSAGTNPVGTDVFMWVSGSRTDNNTGADKVVFGGDVRVSGSLTIGTGSVFITSNDIQFGTSTMRIQKNGNDMKFFDITNPSGYTLTELAAGGGGGLGGSGTTNYVAKFTGTSTLSVSTIFDNGTNVGIGTSSMTKKLVVHGGDALINGLTIGKGNSGNIGNTALGVDALSVSSGDQYNTAVGYAALSSNTSGQGNVAVGHVALSLNTTSSYNIAIGSNALGQGGGGSNLAIGYQSQFSNTDGSLNSSVGHSSLSGITTGAGNVAVGAFAGSYNISGRSRTTTGNNNIFIGVNASAKNSGDSNSIAIGYFAVGLGSDTTVIGNGSTTLTSIPAGNVGIGTASTSKKLVVHGGDALINDVHVGRGGSSSSNLNTAVGADALAANTTSINNTAVGYRALYTNTTGTGYNTAVGRSSLEKNTTGYSNVAVGYTALYLNVGGYGNSAVGTGALYANTTGNQNTAVGNNALMSNTGGNHNTSVGDASLYNNTTGIDNVAVGRASMYVNTYGSYNTAVGKYSLFSNNTGDNNTAVGYSSLNNNDGTHNTAVGVQACYNNTTGNYNTAVGSQALYINNSGNNNTAVGYDALGNGYSISNTAVGYRAIRNISGGDFNVAVGSEALSSNTTGSSNTAVGSEALLSNTTGSANTIVGFQAFTSNTTGSSNVAVGFQTMRYGTGGNRNVAIGYRALFYSGVGSYNVAIGSEALQSVSTGANENIAIGTNALRANTNTTQNIAIGSLALLNYTSVSNKYGYNVAIGGGSLYNTYDSEFNTAIGHQSGESITTGKLNIAIGYKAGKGILGGSSNVAIGQYDAGTYFASSNNYMFLSDGDGNLRMIVDSAGKVGIGLTNPSAMLHVKGDDGIWIQDNSGEPVTHLNYSGNGNHDNYISSNEAGFTMIRTYKDDTAYAENTRFYYAGGKVQVLMAGLGTGTVYSTLGVLSNTGPSDERLKKDIESYSAGLTEVIQLRPVSFKFKDAINSNKQYGFIAQEVLEVLPDLVSSNKQYDKDGNYVGEFYGLEKDGIWAAAVNAIKELKSENDSLKGRIDTLETELQSLKNIVNQLVTKTS